MLTLYDKIKAEKLYLICHNRIAIKSNRGLIVTQNKNMSSQSKVWTQTT